MRSETYILSLAVGKMAFLRLFKPLHKFELKMNAKPHTACVCWCVCKFALWPRGKWRGVPAKRVLGQVQEPGPRTQDPSIMCAGL